MNPVVAIVGAGAVGGYYGARLAQHGVPVHFLMRSGYSAAVRNGLVIQSPDGDFTIQPPQLHVYERPDQMPPADLVIVTLKTTANDQYEPLIRPLIHDRTLILTLQNGLGNEERLAALFGPDHILGGLAFVCINRLDDGTIRHLDHGLIKIGEFSSAPINRTHEIAQLITHCKVRCQVLDDLRYGRWEKLVWNVPFNGLGAVLDKTTDKLISTSEGRSLLQRIMLEVMATAAALGVHLPEDLPDRKLVETSTMGPYRTSMQIDRQEGRPLEIEAILHQPLLAAHAHNVPVPCLQMLYEQAMLP
jgi:2-dehydropantoate 2-reductase